MKVLLTEYIYPPALEKLKQHVEVITDKARVNEVDAIILRALDVDREMMEKAPQPEGDRQAWRGLQHHRSAGR